MTAQQAGLAETSPPADQRLVEDVREGLTADPPTLPPRWFYDEKGSVLFEQITRLEEYYPTRTEESILAEHAGDIAALSGASTLIELGAGSFGSHFVGDVEYLVGEGHCRPLAASVGSRRASRQASPQRSSPSPGSMPSSAAIVLDQTMTTPLSASLIE